jgi:hypothetical protein
MNDPAALLISVLTSAAFRLPILIAVSVSFVWVLGTPRSQVRSVAVLGLSLMAAATLLGLFANLVPQVMVAQGAYESLTGISRLMGWIHFVLNLVEALALVLVVWALTRSLRDRALPPV